MANQRQLDADRAAAEFEKRGMPTDLPAQPGKSNAQVQQEFLQQQAQQTENDRLRQQELDLARQIAAQRASESAADRALASSEAARIRERGSEIAGQFQPGSLGRLENVLSQDFRTAVSEAGGQSADARMAQDLRRSALEGLSSEELNAAESRRLADITRAEQSALRQLRGAQAQAGLRGGLAGAQQADLLLQAARQRAELGQELFLQDAAARRQALDAFQAGEQQRAQNALAARLAEAQLERGVQEFNIGQTGRERFGALGTELGFEQLASSFGLAGAPSIGGTPAARPVSQIIGGDTFLAGATGEGSLLNRSQTGAAGIF